MNVFFPGGPWILFFGFLIPAKLSKAQLKILNSPSHFYSYQMTEKSRSKCQINPSGLPSFPGTWPHNFPTAWWNLSVPDAQWSQYFTAPLIKRWSLSAYVPIS